VNVQDLVVETASVAVHCTGVAPTGNADPDARLQLTCTGGTPPVVVGEGKVTDTAPPENDGEVTAAGQVMVSGGLAGTVVVVAGGTVVVVLVVVVVVVGVGELGDEQPNVSSTAPIAVQTPAKRARSARPGRRITN
jgi:hypothetical protein